MKAFLRGLLISQISKIKKQTNVWERSMGDKVATAERHYINNPSQETLRAWIDKQNNYRLVTLQRSENKYLFQRQVAFGEGETVGRMLAPLVGSNSPTSVVSSITARDGRVTSHPPEIVIKFKEYYEDLYRSRQGGTEDELESFFWRLGPSVPH